MTVWPRDRLTRWSRRVLVLASTLVPRHLRNERRMEWEAELWQLRSARVGAMAGLSWFLAGVVWDAFWEWKEGWSMESLRHDVRYAIRTLARSPGFTAAALTTLALSIGATTALFSVIEKAVLADPPYPDPDRLVVVDMLFGLPEQQMGVSRWSYPRYLALRENVSSFQELAGYARRTMTLTDLGNPEIVSVEVATPTLFPLLGVDAQRGRVFGPEEEYRGSPTMVALVSAGFWESRMGSAPDAVGTTITLDRLSFQVIGVVQEGYAGMAGSAEVWIPMSALREVEDVSIMEDAWNQHFNVVGRLAEGTTLESASSDVAAFGSTIMERFPPPVGAERLRSGSDVVPLKKARGNPTATTAMLALFGGVVLVLLIATANLAGLLLARGAARQREAAVRASLGAGASRLVRQYLTESLTLASIGGVLGMLFAVVGVNLLGSWLTESMGTASGRGVALVDPEALTVDWSVLLFALALTGGVGLAFGLLPALQTARTDPGDWLKGRAGSGGSGRRRPGAGSRGALLVGQVALAVVLLAGASLMMRTTLALERVDLGFERDGLLTAMYTLSPADEQAGIDPAVFHTEVVQRMRGLPGVVDASAGEVPMGGPTWRTIVLGSEGRPDLAPQQHTWIRIQAVSDGHLRTLGARLVEGRGIEPTDDWNTEKVVVLGQSAVAELFPGGSPLGRRIQLGWSGYGGAGAIVVGVVEDLRLDQPGLPPERLAFVALRQAARLETGLLLRTTGDPEALIPAVRSELADMAPDLALTSVMSMEKRAAGATERPRVLTMLLGFFGSVALLLVAVGLYGSIAYAVTRRTRELGLRASLGADRASLMGLMLRQGLGVTFAGIVVGVVGSIWATRLLEGLVFGAGTTDPVGLLGVSGTLLAVGGVAAFLPARRGTRIDPMVALRSD